MGSNIKLADSVRSIANRVTQDAIDKMHALGADSDEDYSDAFMAVGELFEFVSAQMLHDVYKDDEESAVTEQMTQMLKDARVKADEALKSLEPFGFIIEVDNLF